MSFQHIIVLKEEAQVQNQLVEFNEDKEAVPCLMCFSGKQADWRVWSPKNFARVTLKKYANVLTRALKLPNISMPNII